MNTDGCVLKLEHLLFDKISFERKGFQNSNEIKFKFGFNFDIQATEHIIVHIRVLGEKEDEYQFEVQASGYFTLLGCFEKIDAMAKQNAAAIIFPYIRSQITLLTAQPEIEPIILPPLNIANMIQDAEKNN